MTFNEIIFYTFSFLALFTGLYTLLVLLERKDQLNSPKLKSYRKISVIIPAYNEEKGIAASIKKTLECDYPSDLLEIIVVDDGSRDRTYQVAKKLASKNVKVFTKKNGGKASAVNFGLKHATGEFVMILDADTFPQKDAFKKTLGNFEDPSVMATTLSIKVYQPKTFLQKMQYIEYTIMNFMRKLMMFVDGQNVAPAGTILRKSFLDTHGHFDENNLTEDFEMGMRIHSKQFRVAHTFDSYVETVAPETFDKLKRQRVRWSYGGIYNIMLYKNMMGARYGDLGLLIIPGMLIGLTILPLGFAYLLAITLWNALHRSYLFSLIGFDLRYAVSSAVESIVRTSFSMRVFVLVTVLLMAMLIYKNATKKAGEKFKWSYIIYFLFYGLALMYFNVIALARYLINRKPKW